MRRVIFSLAFFGFGLAFGQEESVSVRAVGVTLIWEKVDKEAFDHFAILNSRKPTAVALALKPTGKKIVSIDYRRSKLVRMIDNMGTKIEGKIGPFPKIAKDGSLAFVEVEGESSVSPKATSVLVEGTVDLVLAGKPEQKRSKVVEVKKGVVVKVTEDLVFTIDDAGTTESDKVHLSITLKIKREIPEVAAFRFFDGDGKQITGSRVGSRMVGIGDRVTVTKDFSLDKFVKKFCVEVDLWTDLEAVTVPFALKVGVGGGK